MWFIEMFASADNKARIFAILLASFMAYLGIWYTQNRTDKRASKALIIEKAENCITLLASSKQLMTLTYKLSKTTTRYSIKHEDLSLNELLTKATETLIELEAIMILHFDFSEKARQLFRDAEKFLERSVANKANQSVTNSQFEALNKRYIDLQNDFIKTIKKIK
jgi:hypothetical protein